MARTYSDRFLRELHASEDKSLGVRLARSCVAANLSATHVASALNVTRLTVAKWFRGQQIRSKKHLTVEAFIRLIDSDLSEGVLPVVDHAAAKKYIQAMTGAAD